MGQRDDYFRWLHTVHYAVVLINSMGIWWYTEEATIYAQLNSAKSFKINRDRVKKITHEQPNVNWMNLALWIS